MTVRGQLGIGLGWRRREVSPGLSWRKSQVSAGLPNGPIRSNEISDNQSQVSPGLGWRWCQLSPRLTVDQSEAMKSVTTNHDFFFKKNLSIHNVF